VSPIAFYIFDKPVYWYGIIIALGVLLGIYLAVRHANKLGYNQEVIIDFSLLAIPLAIIGARLYYVIFSWEYYSKNPGDIIKIWEGGLAIYGAVIGGVISALIFARRRKINFWELCDIAAPSLILGQALGRWGNFFNQEAYGYAINNPAWQWFPAAVYITDQGQWHMATFFYESLWNFLVFFFLLYYKKRKKTTGEVFLLYLILYSIGRIVIEGLRTDSLYWGPLRVSQLLSGLLIVAGTALFIVRRKKDYDDHKNGQDKGLGEEEKEQETQDKETQEHGTQDVINEIEDKQRNQEGVDKIQDK